MSAVGTATAVSSAQAGFPLKFALTLLLGGNVGATNSDQLFASSYADCFGNAITHFTRNKKRKIRDDDVEVAVTVGIEPKDTGGFGLSAEGVGALDLGL